LQLSSLSFVEAALFRKNVGYQSVWGQMNSRFDGTPLTSGVAIHVGGQGAYGFGLGVLTHRGLGLWEYTFTQDETNFDQFCYQFTHDSGVNIGGTIMTTSANPHDATAFGLTNLDVATSSRATAVQVRTELDSNSTMFARLWKGLKNKLYYNKTNDHMILYDDDDATPILDHPMVSNASEATRGRGA
jgi:hypothetical protein